MKAIRFFMSPYLLIAAFMLLLISGEHWGGFYLIYLLLALPHGGIHSLLGAGGILCLALAHQRLARHSGLKLVADIVGITLLAGSLFTFFHNDKSGYNASTFDLAIPITTFVIAGALAVIFLVLNITQYLNAQHSKRTLVTESGS